uniref:Uncharacterized protein n=1 Tax=Parascaris equorum TaxID=6256 RepID=A0A914RG13_PAREQ
MEGLYDLIGCSLLGCPALPEFLCSCIGEKCSTNHEHLLNRYSSCRLSINLHLQNCKRIQT